MPQQQRTGKQQALFIVSIISIVAGVVTALFGAAVMAGVGVLASSADTVGELDSALQGSAVTGDQVMGVGVAMGLIGVLFGVLGIVLGILGIRAANDASKIRPFYVLSIAGCVMGIAGVLTGGLANGGISLVLSAVCVWLGYSIQQEGSSR